MKAKLRQEMVGGEVYEYIPLGNYIVSAPAVCRGRPTFKYTRIEVAGVLEWLGAGNSVNKLIKNYKDVCPMPPSKKGCRWPPKHWCAWCLDRLAVQRIEW